MISRRIARELREKEFRNTYKRGRVRTKLAYQMRALRKQRGWLQGDLANAMEKPQSTVSRFEDVDYGKYTLESLFEISDAFDLGLIVEFVGYPEFLVRTSNLSEINLRAESYNVESMAFLERDAASTASHTQDLILPPVPGISITLIEKMANISPIEPGASLGKYEAEIRTGMPNV